MPGVASLSASQYYAHPRNAFWKIMSEYFGFSENIDYQARTENLLNKNVAIWDVLEQCVRKGSLDNDIQTSSVAFNPFETFLLDYRRIKNIIFNGKAAEKYFDRYMPQHDLSNLELSFYVLPSTSPANASLNYREKYSRWEAVLNAALKN
jgi:hypoxanthine-DNA glycosylase